jgi:hypothetical protein
MGLKLNDHGITAMDLINDGHASIKGLKALKLDNDVRCRANKLDGLESKSIHIQALEARRVCAAESNARVLGLRQSSYLMKNFASNIAKLHAAQTPPSIQSGLLTAYAITLRCWAAWWRLAVLPRPYRQRRSGRGLGW